MKYNEIKSIIKDFEASSLTVLELESNDVKLRLSKNKEQALETKVVVQSNDQLISDTTGQKPTVTEAKAPSQTIKSPLVGTFYESSTPNGKPLVKAGDKVKKGQVVCIVEAMKIMNEITSPVDGTIDQVMFKNGAVVGFDDVLFTVV
ncbi:acetyl-CoA carboxylase biotin carboxyl carrier protein [Acholeplasma equirhinis]|uniref:acetyl-CoA carboxylase biotin carboxyl carrier protein n=1 Tax=Acholeplasma equirhinis TaxID=555393 RepID=UPI00197A7A32|nr:acetyl-CoA carboxylase biotin carboxyl carrier protein [Acholeplasma equirhinis]MBN3490186.1 acetyl-CoA carboxylase biotin carboxyl carrier protein [Acholeplasma equirhinis]